MLFMAVLGLVTSLCAAYDGWQDRGGAGGEEMGNPGEYGFAEQHFQHSGSGDFGSDPLSTSHPDHKPGKGDKDGSFKGDGYYDWLSPWNGYSKTHWYSSKKVYPSYTYPVYYYYYSVPYYYYYPQYNWYYNTPPAYDQWWDPWWATNVYGLGGAKYTFKSDWGYHSGFNFGDP